MLVANTLGDSVSIVEPSANRAVEVSLGKSPPLAPRDRGELLFFDASLSHDGWFSCHSCHTDGHSNGLLNDNLGDGSFGAPKRVPSLLGTRATGPWGWDGRTATLEDQVRRSLTSTMQGRATPERVDGLVAYLRALPAPVRLPGADAEAVARGGRVFEERGCARCHRPPAYTTPRVHDVGLADEQGRRRFNPPSLRGVGLGGALLHDGRAADLEDLLGRLRHGLDANPLSDGDWGDLLAFLRSL